MGVGDDASIVVIVIVRCVRDETVKNKNVALLCLNSLEYFALAHADGQIIGGKSRVEIFWVVIKSLANLYSKVLGQRDFTTLQGLPVRCDKLSRQRK